MTTSRLIRPPLWATLLIALVAAMVSYFVFVQSSEAAQATNGQPSAKTPRIVGGTEVPSGKYRFMVALIEKKKEPSATNPYKLVCGGTLIDKDSVLTAGHCLLGPPDFKELYDPQALRVTVGRTVLSSNQGQVRGVKKLSVHPRFKEVPLDPNDPYLVDLRYDAGVIELSRPVKGIKPIELATSKQNYLERPGRSATVAGWGLQLAFPPGGDFPPQSRIQNHMREAQVPLVSDFRAEQTFTDYIPPIMIAAGGKAKEDACLGDSGGPLFVRTSGNNDDGRNGDDNDGGSGGKYTQIGIVSTGAGCGTKGVPGVYAEVNNPSIRSFITNAASK